MLQARPFSLNNIKHLNLSIVWKVAAPSRRRDDRRTIKSHHLDLDVCLIAATCVINKARTYIGDCPQLFREKYFQPTIAALNNMMGFVRWPFSTTQNFFSVADNEMITNAY